MTVPSDPWHLDKWKMRMAGKCTSLHFSLSRSQTPSAQVSGNETTLLIANSATSSNFKDLPIVFYPYMYLNHVAIPHNMTLWTYSIGQGRENKHTIVKIKSSWIQSCILFVFWHMWMIGRLGVCALQGAFLCNHSPVFCETADYTLWYIWNAIWNGMEYGMEHWISNISYSRKRVET